MLMGKQKIKEFFKDKLIPLMNRINEFFKDKLIPPMNRVNLGKEDNHSENLPKNIIDFLAKTNVPYFNYLFILEIVFVWFLPENINLLTWNKIDFGNIFYQIGQFIYNRCVFIDLTIVFCIIMPILIYLSKKHDFLKQDVPFMNGEVYRTSISYAVYHLKKIYWKYIHETWILCVAVILAIGKSSDFKQLITFPSFKLLENIQYWLFCINLIYLIWTIFRSILLLKQKFNPLFETEKIINLKNENRYFIIKHNKVYFFVKDQGFSDPLFYLVHKTIMNIKLLTIQINLLKLNMNMKLKPNIKKKIPVAQLNDFVFNSLIFIQIISNYRSRNYDF